MTAGNCLAELSLYLEKCLRTGESLIDCLRRDINHYAVIDVSSAILCHPYTPSVGETDPPPLIPDLLAALRCRVSSWYSFLDKCVALAALSSLGVVALLTFIKSLKKKLNLIKVRHSQLKTTKM